MTVLICLHPDEVMDVASASERIEMMEKRWLADRPGD
jgi:hypothetical protein